jgi:hypothetical protein
MITLIHRLSPTFRRKKHTMKLFWIN